MSKIELSAFLKMLDDKGVLKFNIDEFEDQLKLQKYVFLSRFFGWNHGYLYTLYVRGPYSRDLADDCYGIDEVMSMKSFENIIPAFDSPGFFALVAGKDEVWLESAATLKSVYEYNKENIPEREAAGFALSRTKELKYKVSEDIINKAYRDLSAIPLIPAAA